MGLIKTGLKAAVAVTTTHYVHERITARQQEQAAVAANVAGPMPDTLSMLTKLGELRANGVLTDAEFEAQKARILAG